MRPASTETLIFGIQCNNMKYISLFLVLLVGVSCTWTKQKTKETANKAGEAVGQVGSEFAEGVAKGVVKTFDNEIQFSDELKRKGLKNGKILVTSSDSAADNVLTPYLIFDDNFDQRITVKVFTASGQEFGRTSLQVKGQKGEARYVDFVFDKRTNIDPRSKVSIE